jgi:hypothetical protein
MDYGYPDVITNKVCSHILMCPCVDGNPRWFQSSVCAVDSI